MLSGQSNLKFDQATNRPQRRWLAQVTEFDAEFQIFELGIARKSNVDGVTTFDWRSRSLLGIRSEYADIDLFGFAERDDLCLDPFKLWVAYRT